MRPTTAHLAEGIRWGSGLTGVEEYAHFFQDLESGR